MLQRIVSFALSMALFSGAGPSRGVPSATSAAADGTETEMTFRKSVQEVHVDFSLSSLNGRPAAALKADDFAIYQDNRPVAGVTGFYADQNLPLHLLLMIDASDSMTRRFPAERNAAITFLRSVVRPGKDHSAVASFSTHLSVESTEDASSPDTLLRIGMLRSQGLTALYDSLLESAAAFREYDGERAASRRVLVLLKRWRR